MPIKPKDDMAKQLQNKLYLPPGAQHKCTEKRAIPGSTAFVPSVAGLIIAGEVSEGFYARRKKCNKTSIYEIHTNHVQLYICQYGIWNDDGECRICVVLFASYKPYRVYRSFSVCPDHIF